MHHADKFVDRIIFLDGFPNMQVLDPLHIGQNVKEILECDLQAEVDARALYQEAATHCAAVKDYPSRDLFEELMADEEDHIDFLETQLDLVEKLGMQLYSQAHIGKPEKGEAECQAIPGVALRRSSGLILGEASLEGWRHAPNFWPCFETRCCAPLLRRRISEVALSLPAREGCLPSLRSRFDPRKGRVKDGARPSIPF